MAIRAKGSSVAVISNVLINIIFNQCSPIAFADVGYKYYSLFICTNIIGAITVYLVFPETKGKSLEEIGVMFGDEMVVQDLEHVREKVEGLEDVEHVERKMD
jgi:hypothetical protein